MTQLTVVYHLYKGYDHSLKSLESLIKQKDKNFQMIFIADAVDKKIKTIFSDFDFSHNFPNAIFINIENYLGHSYSYNFATQIAKTPYIYFASSSCVYEPNFIEKINHAINEENSDLIVFDEKNNHFKKELNILKNENYLNELKILINSSHLNKVFKVDFLNKNNIRWVNFKHYPLVYLYEVYSKLNTVKFLDEVLFAIHTAKKPTYNIADLIYQFEYLNEKYENSPFYQKYIEQIKYLAIRTITFKYLRKIYRKYGDVKHNVFKNSFNFALNYLNENYPEFRNNYYLDEKHNSDDPLLISYIKNFSNSRHTINEFKKILAKYDN